MDVCSILAQSLQLISKQQLVSGLRVLECRRALEFGVERHRRPASLPHHASSAGTTRTVLLGLLLHRGQVDRAS